MIDSQDTSVNEQNVQNEKSRELPMQQGNVLSWASDLDGGTLAQAQRTAALSIVEKPLALMADAHVGMGATIGSVVATKDAIIPAAVGVDIGCGMIAQKTVFTRDQVDAQLPKMHAQIAKAVPAGQPRKGKRTAGSHDRAVRSKKLEQLIRDAPDVRSEKFNAKKISGQFGTLGGGNHFIELATDETDQVWIVLHSGSRGPGNLFAQEHIGRARNMMKKALDTPLEDPDLASFVQGTDEFARYIDGMLWAQDYAFENRAQMMKAVLGVVGKVMEAAGMKVGFVAEGKQIQCHHNYASCESHGGQQVWVTRKGAIDASLGNWGVIPGSMATGSFIVSGLGNAASYRSASHGAGRRLSRRAARKQLSTESLQTRMENIAWNDNADALLDEHPDAYKDISEVMANQRDLVDIEHRLETILNYKGT